jgi:hypothetical protein
VLRIEARRRSLKVPKIASVELQPNINNGEERTRRGKISHKVVRLALSSVVSSNDRKNSPTSNVMFQLIRLEECCVVNEMRSAESQESL